MVSQQQYILITYTLVNNLKFNFKVCYLTHLFFCVCMKFFIKFFWVPFVSILFSCQPDSVSELSLIVTKLDNGKVKVEANASGAQYYRFTFGDNNEYIEQESGVLEYTYTNVGEYIISVRAFFDSNNLENNLVKATNVSITNALGGGSSGQFVDSSINATIYQGYTLVFSDEFNYQGAPLDSKWHLQYIPIAGGGWANGEEQHYTTRRENSFVSDGKLKIIAKREKYTYNGSQKSFTSARLNSKFEFKYGRVDVLAKLPAKPGTWPAIWTLGSNINEVGNYFGNSNGSVGWPECGEIDIMEQYGSDKSKVLGTFHWKDKDSNTHSMFPTNGSGLNVSGTSSDFHLYSLLWDSNTLKIFVDNRLVTEMSNKASEEEFRNPHYLLLNLAMGGSLGGAIPSNFNEDIFEIDFVRIYQKI